MIKKDIEKMGILCPQCMGTKQIERNGKIVVCDDCDNDANITLLSCPVCGKNTFGRFYIFHDAENTEIYLAICRGCAKKVFFALKQINQNILKQ